MFSELPRYLVRCLSLVLWSSNSLLTSNAYSLCSFFSFGVSIIHVPCFRLFQSSSIFYSGFCFIFLFRFFFPLIWHCGLGSVYWPTSSSLILFVAMLNVLMGLRTKANRYLVWGFILFWLDVGMCFIFDISTGTRV